MKITLNLATKPYADQGPALKRLRIGMAVLAGILLLLGLGLLNIHQKALHMRAQQEDIDAKIAAVQREEQGYKAQMQQPENARVLTQSVFLNGLFEEKSFSWTAAMEDLERVLPGGVQVTALEPVRAKDGRLTLRLRVSGQRERAVELVRKMEHSPRFGAPRISGENAEVAPGQGAVQQVRDADKVTFEILAEYNPATLEQRKQEIAAQKHPRTSSELTAGSGPVVRRARPTMPRPVPNSMAKPGYVPPNTPPQMPRPMPNGGPQ
jgi:type IV pilus assembly protein PilN